MEPVEIRAATPADADAVEGYHHRCFTTAGWTVTDRVIRTVEHGIS